jgi:hypothetical protein
MSVARTIAFERAWTTERPAKGRDHRRTEGRQIVGLRARNERRVDDDFPVYPACACVGQIGLQRRPGSHGPAAYGVRLYQGPGTVADGGHGLAAIVKVADEGHRSAIQSQVVG